MTTEQTMSYAQAILEATYTKMEEDSSMCVMGLGVNDGPSYVYGTTKGLKEFGPARVFNTPISEDGMTGVAIGMCLAGKRVLHVHIRMDFLLLAMNQILNCAAHMRYMYGGRVKIPLTIRAIVGRSWGQGPQHSKALHSMFCHVPGLRVYAPPTAQSVYSCLWEALSCDDPCIVIEHRHLHGEMGTVCAEKWSPEPLLLTYAGGPGSDVVLIGIGQTYQDCLVARQHLLEEGIQASVLCPVVLEPLPIMCSSPVWNARKVVIVDAGWRWCGLAAEIATRLFEVVQSTKGHVEIFRMGFATTPCPTSHSLERGFYPNSYGIFRAGYQLVKGESYEGKPKDPNTTNFKGPF